MTAGPDIFNLASDVESAGGKLDCLLATVNYFADNHEGQTGLLFFSVLYSLETVIADLKETQDALYQMARERRVGDDDPGPAAA